MQKIILTLLAGGDGDAVRDPMKMSPWPELLCCLRARIDHAAAASGITAAAGGGWHPTVDEFNAWFPDAATQQSSGGPSPSPPKTRRVIKTHSPAQLAPWRGGIPAGARIVVVGRNPKDTAVSAFNHAKDVSIFEYTGSWSHFLSEPDGESHLRRALLSQCAPYWIAFGPDFA